MEQLNYAAVAKVRAALLDDGYAVSSVNMALSALRGVAQTAFNLNYMDAETLARIRSVKRVSGDIQRKGRALDRQEIRALIQAARQHPQPVRRCRDTAIVLTLCGTGLRAGELVKLERRDYANGILTVRQGKGRKYREIHVADAVDKAIRVWLKVSADEADSALFRRIQRSGKVASQPLTTTGLTGIWLIYSRRQVLHVSPHMTCGAPSSPVYWSRAWISTPSANWQATATYPRRRAMTVVVRA